MYKTQSHTNIQYLKQYLTSYDKTFPEYLDGTSLKMHLTDNEKPITEPKEVAKISVMAVRRQLGYKQPEHAKPTINRYMVAKEVMRLVNLLTLEEDTKQVLIHNHIKGVWELAEEPLKRLVIEMIHSLPEAKSRDIWTKALEESVLDIIRRKTEIKSLGNFNKRYFAFKNFTYDSLAAKFVPHSEKCLTTYASNVQYEENATCPNFLDFLKELSIDTETIAFIQEWFGYAISTSHKANAFLIGVGEGANGKSTLFDVLMKLIGVSNISSAPLSNLNTQFGIEPILGKKLNIATESGADAFNTANLKAITAGERISVNRKNKPEITTVVDAKLIFLMNELPLLKDNSHGLARRLYILPFSKVFQEEDQDKDLPRKLEAELSGILNWAVEGHRRLKNQHYTFTKSKRMTMAKSKYMSVGNPVRVFVEECIVSHPGNNLDSNAILSAYRSWVSIQKLPFHGTDSPQVFWSQFRTAMNSCGIHYTKSKSNGTSKTRDINLK